VLEEVLLEVVVLLRRTFPNGIPEADYPALLVVLSEELAEENLGKVVEEFTGRNQYLAIYDAVRAQTTMPPDHHDVDRVRDLLAAHGWTSED
jgi:hypothetical protein